jgi:hypothetical protein
VPVALGSKNSSSIMNSKVTHYNQGAAFGLIIIYFGLPGKRAMQMSYDKQNYRQYWKDRASELISINHAIWGFVGAAALIDCGAKLANKGISNRTTYKSFVKTLDLEGMKYANFTYQGGQKDLDIQMYHTFRCGLLHSFSLTTDDKAPPEARPKSVVLSAVKDGENADNNCTLYTDNCLDACQLVLEPFVEDIGKAIDRLFDDVDLDESIRETYNSNPPFNAFASRTITP